MESEGHTCLIRAQAHYQGSGHALWMPLPPGLFFWSLIAFSLDLIWSLRTHPAFSSFGNPVSLVTH